MPMDMGVSFVGSKNRISGHGCTSLEYTKVTEFYPLK